ncbi:MAG: hypothetical protein AAGG08_12285, partial [Actinomycetota bacterium]
AESDADADADALSEADALSASASVSDTESVLESSLPQAAATRAIGTAMAVINRVGVMRGRFLW